MTISWGGTFAVFALLGMGSNWVLPTALFQQIPYLQRRLPEHLCLATQMNASVNAGVLMVVLYLTLLRKYGNAEGGFLSYSSVVPLILACSCAGTFLASFIYVTQIGGVSLPLYLVCAIGGAVGSTSAVVMNPYLMRFQSDFISATRAGGSGLILLTGIVAFVQRPGSTEQRFPPSTYFQIFGFILLVPLAAVWFIERNKPGLRDSHGDGEKATRQAEEAGAETGSSHSSLSSHSSHPLRQCMDESGAGRGQQRELELPAVFMYSSGGPSSGSGETLSPLPLSSLLIFEHHQQQQQQQSAGSPPGWDWGQALADRGSALLVHGCLALVGAVCPSWATALPPWLPRVLPYCLAVGFINFNSWGLLSAVSPFAFSNAVPASVSGDGSLGSENLASAYEVGSLCLVLGDLSTTVVTIPFRASLGLFLLLAGSVYASALGSSAFHSASAGPLLILAFGLSRFLEAHTVTAAYRAVAAALGSQDSEHGARAVGIFDLASTTVGQILATTLINTVAKC